MPVEISLLRGAPEEIAGIQSVCEGSAEFIALLRGKPLTADTGHELFHWSQAGVPQAKMLTYGIYLGKEMIGFAHLASDFPVFSYVRVGCLVLHEAYRNRRYGSDAWKLIEQEIVRWPLIGTIILGVFLTRRNASRFWEREGFAIVSRKSNHLCPDGTTLGSQLMTKPLGPLSAYWPALSQSWFRLTRPSIPSV